MSAVSWCPIHLSLSPLCRFKKTLTWQYLSSLHAFFALWADKIFTVSARLVLISFRHLHSHIMSLFSPLSLLIYLRRNIAEPFQNTTVPGNQRGYYRIYRRLTKRTSGPPITAAVKVSAVDEQAERISGADTTRSRQLNIKKAFC